MTTTAPLLDSRVIGVAHYTTRAVLEHVAAPYGLSFRRTVTLRQIALADGPVEVEHVVRTVAGATAMDPADVRDTVGELTSAALVTPDGPSGVRLTDTGRDVFAKVTAESAAVAARIYDGISEEDRAVSGRVLTRVTERAAAELAALRAA